MVFSLVLSFTTETVAADASGLVAHWKFDGSLDDSSGINNGVSIGKIAYTDAIFGKGAKFDGKSYIEVADNDSLDLTNAFTFSFWAYKDATKTILLRAL